MLDRRSSSARARSCRTRPRRCGCRSGRGCAARACARWPRRPSGSPAREPHDSPSSPRIAPRPTRHPRAAAPRPAAGRRRRVVVLQRRGLVEDLVCRPRELGARPWPSPGLSHVDSIAALDVGEDQSREPGRRARRRRDDPDHLGLHQRAADPALPRPRADLLRPRDREPRRERRPDHGRRRQRDQGARGRRQVRDDHPRRGAGRGVRPEGDVPLAERDDPQHPRRRHLPRADRDLQHPPPGARAGPSRS